MKDLYDAKQKKEGRVVANFKAMHAKIDKACAS